MNTLDKGNGIDWEAGIQTRPDGSFVVTKNGYPYHIPAGVEEFAMEYLQAQNFAAEHPELVTPEPQPEPPSLEELRAARRAAIDAETSAAIRAGFDYEIDAGNGPENLHFSYDSFDQQNFVDTANVAILALSGHENLPQSVSWNAYRNWTPESGGELVRLTLTPAAFLALYTGGAIAHKATRMEIGGRLKAEAMAAQSREDLDSLGWDGQSGPAEVF